jgi:Ca-activated chloride channel family protein
LYCEDYSGNGPRDLVIDVELSRIVSTTLIEAAKGETAIVASFIPKGDWSKGKGRNVKLVIDCSGSMMGDSIGSARRAAERVIGSLGPKDSFNLIRFGSRAQAMFPGQVKATPGNIALAEDCLRLVDADMGGTEIGAALRAAYASKNGEIAGGDIILITDGQAYNTAQLIEDAVASGNRIFAVGVGNAIQEDLLRSLSDGTAGAVEFVTPGEAVKGAIERQFARVRSGIVTGINITWPGRPVEKTELPKSVFAGDAIHAAAVFKQAPKVRSFSLSRPRTARSFANPLRSRPSRRNPQKDGRLRSAGLPERCS